MDQVQAQNKRLSAVPTDSVGLRVFWSRSVGHVDWYDVSLEDTSSGSTLRTRVMGSAAPQSGFSSLVPGSLYRVSVVATAGNRSAAPVHTTAATGDVHLKLNTSCCQSYLNVLVKLLLLVSLVQLRPLSVVSRWCPRPHAASGSRGVVVRAELS